MLKHNDQCTGLDNMEETPHILHSKAAKIFNLQKISTYSPLLINGKVHTEPIVYVSNQFRTSHSSALYHSRCIIWEKRMSTECAEVSK